MPSRPRGQAAPDVHEHSRRGASGNETDVFLFPAWMPEETARQLVGQAYRKVNAGKVVRATTRRAREEGLEPPFDVGYVARPDVAPFEGGLGISLGSDILLYEEFPGWERCLAIFDDEVERALMQRLEKAVARWVRRNRAPDNR